MGSCCATCELADVVGCDPLDLVLANPQLPWRHTGRGMALELYAGDIVRTPDGRELELQHATVRTTGGPGQAGQVEFGATDFGSDHLVLGQSLPVGYQLWNNLHDTRFVMQSDGNLVAYTGQVVWASGTYGQTQAVEAKLQPDGAFEILDGNGRALWSNGKGGSGGVVVVVQDDGNIVEYTKDGTPVWATNSQKNNGPFAAILDALGTIGSYLQVAGTVFGFPLTNINTMVLTGQSPLDALKADVTIAINDKKIAEAVSSGDYMQAWGLATHNGAIFDASLPTPPGQQYANGVTVPAPAQPARVVTLHVGGAGASTPAPTGMSTGAKVAIGTGVAGVGLAGVWWALGKPMSLAAFKHAFGHASRGA